MKISCKMITCGRPHLLVEALHSFLQQDDLGDTELIIVNDYKHQKLIFDHPNVKIWNFDKLFPSIGEKENFALEQCSGDIFVVWDDDDIAMPWHLNNIRKYFKEDTNLLHWANGAFYNTPDITGITSLGNSGIVYSKKAWEAIGKSPMENAGGDMTLTERIKALDESKVVYAHPPDNEVSWFYRWSLPQCYHQSGMGTDTPDRVNVVQRNYDYLESERAHWRIPTGDVVLQPKWHQDYKQLLYDYTKPKS